MWQGKRAQAKPSKQLIFPLTGKHCFSCFSSKDKWDWEKSGADCQRSRDLWELRLIIFTLSRAGNVTQPLWSLRPCAGAQLVNWQQYVYMLACHWWGHFHLPFIYWATFLTLPLGWSLLSSSLVCSLWFICNNSTHQVCSILLICKPEDDINTWRSPIFSLKTYRFH